LIKIFSSSDLLQGKNYCIHLNDLSS